MLPNHRQRWWQGASVPSFEEEESCNFWWKNWRELGVFWFSTVQSLADEVWAREPLWEWHRRKGMEQHQLCQRILKCELVSLVWCFLFTLQFGIEDLKALPDQTSCWDGVRNYQVELQHRVLQKEDVYLKKGAMRCYSWKGFSVSAHCANYFWICYAYLLQARNFMRQMKEGQLAFFYHSNCKEPGIAGLMKVSRSSIFR